MTRQNLVQSIDHTCLKPTTTIMDITNVCIDGLKYSFASICIPPYYVLKANDFIGTHKLVIGTVVGFPFGYNTTKAKIYEAERVLFDGAEEIDMLMNIAAFKSRNYKEVIKDIQAVVKLAKGKHNSIIIKAIIECCYLNDEEKRLACDLVAESGADYIKTSTGFGSGGATPGDISLLKEHIDSKGYNLKIKAAGGIKTLENAQVFIALGANRIGTSSGDCIINEFDYEMKN